LSENVVSRSIDLVGSPELEVNINDDLPRYVSPDSSLDVEFTAENTGNRAWSGAVQLQRGTRSNSVGEVSIELAPGESVTRAITMTEMIDTGTELSVSPAGNEQWASEWHRIESGAPPLDVSLRLESEIPDSVNLGASFSVHYEVENVGDGSWLGRMELRSDHTDIRINSERVDLEPGETVFQSQKFERVGYRERPEDDFDIRVEAEGTDDSSERHTVGYPPEFGLDVVMNDDELPTVAGKGDVIEVPYTVTNTGNIPWEGGGKGKNTGDP
jgi:hypothetical protein